LNVFVGTSGWAYDWNEGGNLDWFIENSGLNAVELNASFYRFPYRNQILGWTRKGKGLRWSVKVHRSVTHTHQFNERAAEVWSRFFDAFAPLDPFIDFYLFQAPPRFTDAKKVIAFAERAGLGERFAVEIRNAGLLSDDDACRSLQEHMTLVSVDSPVVFNRIFPGRTIYLRMHGREGWYSHDYMDAEMEETAGLLKTARPDWAYVFFNNDHAMLENARRMLRTLGGNRSKPV